VTDRFPARVRTLEEELDQLRPAVALPPTPDIAGPVIERLRGESASLREIASWPGMGVERASRMLNALYLASSLLTTRSHPAARPQPKPARFGLRRKGP